MQLTAEKSSTGKNGPARKPAHAGRSAQAVTNNIQQDDQPFHSWYQFVLGFPPHLVRHYLSALNVSRDALVLDPFCGTGTTNVECKKLGIHSVGVEANPLGHFASATKTTWDLDAGAVRSALERVIASAYRSFEHHGIPEDADIFSSRDSGELVPEEDHLTEAQAKLLLSNSISETPLRRALLLRDCIHLIQESAIRDLMLLAFAKLLVTTAGNVAFGPEVYIKKPKQDVLIIEPFARLVSDMIEDLAAQPRPSGACKILRGDSRRLGDVLKDHRGKIGCVLTSPPYPNEKDYTRSTRLENVLLGFIQDRKALRALKEGLLRSNSRNVFASDTDASHVRRFKSIADLAQEIERRRIELKKTSGFERAYHKVVLHYFGGMYRHLKSLRPLLADGARLAYVVGDQMSFFRAPIRTAQLLAELAEDVGYEVERIELWRTRLATATKKMIDENVLILRN